MILVAVVLFGLLLPIAFLAVAADSLMRGHDLPTSKRATKALAAAIKRHKPDAKIFYDLGCGHGTLALRLKKLIPCLEIHGVDNSAIRIFLANLQSHILGRNAHFEKRDIFSTQMENADVVYTYLWYDTMPPLKKKLSVELKPGAIVITNTSHFHQWQPVEKIITCAKPSKTPNFETLFVYKKS